MKTSTNQVCYKPPRSIDCIRLILSYLTRVTALETQARGRVVLLRLLGNRGQQGTDGLGPSPVQQRSVQTLTRPGQSAERRCLGVSRGFAAAAPRHQRGGDQARGPTAWTGTVQPRGLRAFSEDPPISSGAKKPKTMRF